MNFQTTILAILVTLLGIAYYTLSIQALSDLRRRARVRGDSRVLWVLTILCVPIGGVILYHWMGPTSFRSRPLTTLPDIEVEAQPSNITPISAARSVRRQTTGDQWPSSASSTRSRKPGRIDRTVS